MDWSYRCQCVSGDVQGSAFDPSPAFSTSRGNRAGFLGENCGGKGRHAGWDQDCLLLPWPCSKVPSSLGPDPFSLLECRSQNLGKDGGVCFPGTLGFSWQVVLIAARLKSA